MSVGWFLNLTAAETYFTDERLVTTSWDALTDAQKNKALKNGYNRIYYDSRYSVPTYAAATAAELVILSKVNGEMAYYLAQHMEDEDRRQGLRAQGVIEAGIVEEKYKKDVESPIPAYIEAMLEDEGFTTAVAFGMVNLERDEDESVDEKVDDF